MAAQNDAEKKRMEAVEKLLKVFEKAQENFRLSGMTDEELEAEIEAAREEHHKKVTADKQPVKDNENDKT